MGIGAQDDFAYAERFVSQTRTTFTMLWSDSNESWRHFDVRRNSSVRMLDRGGNLADDSPSSFNRARLQDALDSLS